MNGFGWGIALAMPLAARERWASALRDAAVTSDY